MACLRRAVFVPKHRVEKLNKDRDIVIPMDEALKGVAGDAILRVVAHHQGELVAFHVNASMVSVRGIKGNRGRLKWCPSMVMNPRQQYGTRVTGHTRCHNTPQL